MTGAVLSHAVSMAGLAGVPLVVGALAARLSRRMALRADPAAATVLLSAVAISVAAVTGLLLATAGLVGLGEISSVLTLRHWWPERLRTLIPLPTGVAGLAGLLAAILLLSASRHGWRAARTGRRLATAAATLRPAGGNLVVVEDGAAVAYAIPGRNNRIVVSTGLLAVLPAAQRRAMLAHEQAHLRHHHGLFVQAGRLAAAANPLMRPVSRAIDLAVERWADDAAAQAVGDRRVVARAVATAALAGRAGSPAVVTPRPSPDSAVAPSGAPMLAGAANHVVDRVAVLLAPSSRVAPGVRTAVAVTLAGLGIVACWLSGGVLVAHVHALMELAERLAAH